MTVESHSTHHTSDGEIFTDWREAEEHEARIWLEAWLRDAHGVQQEYAWYWADLIASNADSLVYRLQNVVKDYRISRKDEYR